MTSPQFKMAYLIGLGLLLGGVAINQHIIAGIGGLIMLLWVLFHIYLVVWEGE